MDVATVIAQLRTRLPDVLVALDFDGTLAPIVPDPQSSRPVPGTLEALAALRAAGAQLAVITGRDAVTAARQGGFDAVPGVEVLGLYGLESRRDGQLRTVPEPPALAAARERLPPLLAAAGTDPRVWIEDKRLSLVVHARRLAEPGSELARVRGPVAELAADLGLELHDGRGVLEIRLPGFDKGGALRSVLARTASRAVLFAGDDVGDLPAFAAVRALREGGLLAYSVAVRSAEAPAVADAADAVVDSPEELVAVLRSLAAAATPAQSPGAPPSGASPSASS